VAARWAAYELDQAEDGQQDNDDDADDGRLTQEHEYLPSERRCPDGQPC
jgi:hypothetical protein